MTFIEQKITKGDTVEDVKENDAEKRRGRATNVVNLAEYLEQSIGRKAKPAATKKAAKKAAKKTAKHAKKATSRKGRRSA
jgi:DNA end-binding protein Ku